MIDLHCHFLQGIDDGAQSLTESLQLARYAVANGITHSVMTPHIHTGRYDNTRSKIEKAVETFRQTLDREGIPLALSVGAEVRIGADNMVMVANDEIPFLGELDGYRVMLLELPHESVPVGSINLVRWLLAKKIRPMIAHPERNKDVMRDIDRIIPFLNEGCLLQLTAASVAGRFGSQCERVSRQMLENDWVFAIATDAHNMAHRPPDLAAGRDAAAEVVGADKARQLVEENPAKLLG